MALVARIDDATSHLTARFYPPATVEAHMDLAGRWLRRRITPGGRPTSPGSDKPQTPDMSPVAKMRTFLLLPHKAYNCPCKRPERAQIVLRTRVSRLLGRRDKPFDTLGVTGSSPVAPIGKGAGSLLPSPFLVKAAWAKACSRLGS